MKYKLLNKKLRKRIRIIYRSGNILFLIKYLYRKQFYKHFLKRYKQQKPPVRAPLVIYSCITGGYDLPKKLHNIKPDYDYVMFTDRPELYDPDEYVWEFRCLDVDGLNDSKASRYPKLNPHELFPEYQESVWIDANIDILSDRLYEDVEQVRNENALLAIGVHPKRNCIYQEFERCIAGHIDDQHILREQMNTVKSSGYPAQNGLFENNIIYRKHHHSKVKQFGEDCWKMLSAGSKRDQLSLSFCAWKNGLKIVPLNTQAYRRMLKDIIIFPHL